MSDGLLGIVQRLYARVTAVEVAVPSSPVWATVTAVSPPRVRRDGYLEPEVDLDVNLAGDLAVGRRVLVQQYGRRVVAYGPQPAVPDTGWVAVSDLRNGWGANSDHPPQVRRRGGVVMTRGLVTRASLPSAETEIAYLPVGFWPEAGITQRHFPVATGATDQGVVGVYPTGLLQYKRGNTSWLSLDGIVFWAA